MTGELKLGSGAPGVIGKTIVVDALLSERNITFLKEFFPTNPLCPFTNTLILFRIGSISNQDFLDGRNGLRPTGSSIRQEGDNQLGEFRSTDSVGNLTTNQEWQYRRLPDQQEASPDTWCSSYRRTYNAQQLL